MELSVVNLLIHAVIIFSFEMVNLAVKFRSPKFLENFISSEVPPNQQKSEHPKLIFDGHFFSRYFWKIWEFLILNLHKFTRALLSSASDFFVNSYPNSRSIRRTFFQKSLGSGPISFRNLQFTLTS
jgi:hypothetical protein